MIWIVRALTSGSSPARLLNGAARANMIGVEPRCGEGGPGVTTDNPYKAPTTPV